VWTLRYNLRKNLRTAGATLPNSAVNGCILKCVIKARLQTLSTKYNLSMWFPKHHEPFCLLHSDKMMESTAHIMNGCPAFKGLYIERHNCIVNTTAAQSFWTKCNKTVRTSWFLNLNDNINSSRNVFREYPNTPDIVVVNELSRKNSDSGSGLLFCQSCVWRRRCHLYP